MSLEEDGLDEAIRAVSQARVLVGMHGAGLGLRMLMSSGTLLIEIWPFGVDPASARVYRAMCGLRGFGVTYRAWVNEDVGNTRTHPHYPQHFGGIQHLPQEERRRVVSSLRGDKLVNVTCCMDVDWLYRIYQDTVVRLHAHGDAHGRAHEAHTLTDTHTGALEVNADRDAHEAHTPTNTHRRTRTNALEVNAHRDAHRATQHKKISA
ncbi:protein O-linked-mannose beta-1,4-N-acetylglucosaminyltransferase 2-like [Scylla paramamosain]|uniref:protein O-linked-mannose beta-1,4-N-acetylglucosaminyltransferase 2-like n=1 Tax=Scylla paramamosain TaxID=85552 RepID=UPI003083153D